VRVYDSESPARKSFKGQHWYAPDENYKITADFHPYPQGKTIAITNILGDTQPVPCPGYVTFPLNGRLISGYREAHGRQGRDSGGREKVPSACRSSRRARRSQLMVRLPDKEVLAHLEKNLH
jgi:hypothetical protein